MQAMQRDGRGEEAMSEVMSLKEWVLWRKDAAVRDLEKAQKIADNWRYSASLIEAGQDVQSHIEDAYWRWRGMQPAARKP